MRFGLVGTGPWAHRVHGPGLAGATGIDLVGVWGRTRDRTRALAGDLGVAAVDDLDELLEQVDAVAFAVPPDVQVELAERAARAGVHLLLDKPVATDSRRARELADLAQAHSVSSLVFFTDQFTDSGAGWHADLAGREWSGGDVRWLAALDSPGNPYAESVWRRKEGALWDIGPHALATLMTGLGPATDVVAVAGRADLVHLVLTHEGWASSTATLSLFAPPAAVSHEVSLWGATGISRMPARIPGEAVPALGRAAHSLADSARSGRPHPCDLRLGVRITELLEKAARQLGR